MRQRRKPWIVAGLALVLGSLLYGFVAPDRVIGGPLEGTPFPSAEQPGDLLIQPGRTASRAALGFGWGRPEITQGRRFAWIQRKEADVYVDLPGAPADMEVWLSAKPLWLAYRRQVIALYVNGRYFTEWVCPESPDFATYRAVLPARLLQPERNTLTLRMAYRKSGGDRRKLALGVEAILLRRT